MRLLTLIYGGHPRFSFLELSVERNSFEIPKVKQIATTLSYVYNFQIQLSHPMNMEPRLAYA